MRRSSMRSRIWVSLYSQVRVPFLARSENISAPGHSLPLSFLLLYPAVIPREKRAFLTLAFATQLHIQSRSVSVYAVSNFPITTALFVTGSYNYGNRPAARSRGVTPIRRRDSQAACFIPRLAVKCIIPGTRH